MGCEAAPRAASVIFELGYHPGITQKWLIGAVEKSL